MDMGSFRTFDKFRGYADINKPIKEISLWAIYLRNFTFLISFNTYLLTGFLAVRTCYQDCASVKSAEARPREAPAHFLFQINFPSRSI